jgi:hypothetical protein
MPTFGCRNVPRISSERVRTRSCIGPGESSNGGRLRLGQKQIKVAGDDAPHECLYLGLCIDEGRATGVSRIPNRDTRTVCQFGKLDAISTRIAELAFYPSAVGQFRRRHSVVFRDEVLVCPLWLVLARGSHDMIEPCTCIGSCACRVAWSMIAPCDGGRSPTQCDGRSSASGAQ